MEWFYEIFVYASLAVTSFIWLFWNRIHNLPPGPMGLPIVGYSPFLGKYPYLTLMDLAKTYGSVFTLPMGSKSVLVLNDWAAMKEALVEKADIFAGRPKSIIVETITEFRDLSFSDGNGWKERRRFTLQHLRDFGFGKNSMEEIIMTEANKVIDRLKTNPVAEMSTFFFFSFMNITWRVVGGKSFNIEDKYMQKFDDVIKRMFDELDASNVISFIPFLKYVPGVLSGAVKVKHDLYKFLDGEIDEHIATYQKGYNRDFIDVYLEEIFKYQEQGLKTKAFTRDFLKNVMVSLFSAGIDTSSNTLTWAILYMITWPEIQQKVHDELDEVIGTARLPTYSDKSLLPYTDAVIQEIHRYATIVPLSIPHRATTDTTIQNYCIPKDTSVLQNIWAVHHDPKLWGDPESFRPERFLNSAGQIKKPEYLIPFSMGKRYCLGEPLARMEVFLFFSSLMHTFTFCKLPGVPPPSLDPVYSLTLGSQPFSIIAKPRH